MSTLQYGYFHITSRRRRSRKGHMHLYLQVRVPSIGLVRSFHYPETAATEDVYLECIRETVRSLKWVPLKWQKQEAVIAQLLLQIEAQEAVTINAWRHARLAATLQRRYL